MLQLRAADGHALGGDLEVEVRQWQVRRQHFAAQGIGGRGLADGRFAQFAQVERLECEPHAGRAVRGAWPCDLARAQAASEPQVIEAHRCRRRVQRQRAACGERIRHPTACAEQAGDRAWPVGRKLDQQVGVRLTTGNNDRALAADALARTPARTLHGPSLAGQQRRQRGAGNGHRTGAAADPAGRIDGHALALKRHAQAVEAAAQRAGLVAVDRPAKVAGFDFALRRGDHRARVRAAGFDPTAQRGGAAGPARGLRRGQRRSRRPAGIDAGRERASRPARVVGEARRDRHAVQPRGAGQLEAEIAAAQLDSQITHIHRDPGGLGGGQRQLRIGAGDDAFQPVDEVMQTKLVHRHVRGEIGPQIDLPSGEFGSHARPGLAPRHAHFAVDAEIADAQREVAHGRLAGG